MNLYEHLPDIKPLRQKVVVLTGAGISAESGLATFRDSNGLWKQYDANGVKGIRETSTMPGSAGSSWYYMRYIDPNNDEEFANQEQKAS